MPPWTWLLLGLLALYLGWRVLRAAGTPAGPTPAGDRRTASGWEDDGPGNPAVLGPDQTNINPPETYVIHHEGKGQGLDIANRALRELTRHLSPDAPGTGPVRVSIPGRVPVVEEDLVGTAARESGHPDRTDGRGPGGAVRDGFLEDGSAGRRLSPAPTHMEAAAELAYPYRPAPFTGRNRHKLREDVLDGTHGGARAEVRNRMMQVADQLRRGPYSSRPGQGDTDPAHGGATGDHAPAGGPEHP